MIHSIILMVEPVTGNKEEIAQGMFHSFIWHAMELNQDSINTPGLENVLHIFEPNK